MAGGRFFMISRRKLFGFLAAGAVVGTELIAHRTIFLPPRGGWPRWALVSLVIPKDQLPFYADDIAAGRFTYDESTEIMTLLQPNIGHINGKFHSRSGRTYEWDAADK